MSRPAWRYDGVEGERIVSTLDSADLFRFEVPTSRGVFVVIGPDTLSASEAERVSAQIARLIPILVLKPDEIAAVQIPRCTYRFTFGPCGLPESDSVHVHGDERMRLGAHVFRVDPVRRR